MTSRNKAEPVRHTPAHLGDFVVANASTTAICRLIIVSGSHVTDLDHQYFALSSTPQTGDYIILPETNGAVKRANLGPIAVLYVEPSNLELPATPAGVQLESWDVYVRT